MAQEVEVDEIISSEVLRDRKAIRLTCQAADNTQWEITIKMGATAQFLTALVSSPLDHSHQPDNDYFRPLPTRGARAFRLHNGDTGLAFLIADRVDLPIYIPKAAIPGLRKQLDILEKL